MVILQVHFNLTAKNASTLFIISSKKAFEDSGELTFIHGKCSVKLLPVSFEMNLKLGQTANGTRSLFW